MKKERTTCSSRPLMFIGDNLGIVVIKECMMLCGMENDLRKHVVWATIGILTLQTPKGQLDWSQLYSEILRWEVQSSLTGQQPMHKVLSATMSGKSAKWESTYGPPEMEYGKPANREVQYKWQLSRTDDVPSTHSASFGKFYEWHADYRPAMALTTVTLDGPKDYSKVASTVQTSLEAYRTLKLAQDGEVDNLMTSFERRNYTNINLQDGMWRSALHLAARNGQLDIIKILSSRGDASFFSKKDKDGRNALHYAALYCLDGDTLNEIVRILVNGGIDLDTRDNSGLSARQAAVNRQVAPQLLQKNSPFTVVPSNSTSPDDIPSFKPERPSLLAGQVCRGFRATLVESYKSAEKGERVYIQQPSVWELLYQEQGRLERFFPVGRHKSSEDLNKPADVLQFRWYHLPVNHVGWVRDLFAQMKVATEPPEHDQHDGESSWSRYMRPQARNFEYEQYLQDFDCSPDGSGADWTKRERGIKDFVLFVPFLNFEMQSAFLNLQRVTANRHPPPLWADLAEGQEQTLRQRKTYSDRLASSATEHEILGVRDGADSTTSTGSAASRVSKRDMADDGIGVWNPDTPTLRPAVKPSRTPYDPLTLEEKLVYGYPSEDSSDFHPRRTLDQAHYPMLPDTKERDNDQVVLRRQREKGQREKWPGQKARWSQTTTTHRLIMVDQLWIWVIGDTIVTSFPQKWTTECDVLEQLLLHLKKPQRAYIPTVQDLADLIIKACVSVFNNPDPRAELQMHDLFETSVGDVADRQTYFFRTFKEQLRALSSQSTREKEKSKGMDMMYEVVEDMKLLDEIRDLRDELKMVLKVLDDQAVTVKEMLHILDQDEPPQERSSQSVEPKSRGGAGQGGEWRRQRRIEEQFRRRYGVIEVNNRDFSRMLAHVDTTYEEANSLLDLKQKQLNVLEARAARQGANTIVVFTVASILFGGLSFVTAFFALNVAAFPHQADDTVWNLGYIIGYVAAISFGLTLPFMVAAFWVNLSQETVAFLRPIWGWIGRFLRLIWRRLSRKSRDDRLRRDWQRRPDQYDSDYS